MERLDQIKNAIDEAIISSEKKYLPLRTANKLLWDKRLISQFERDRGYLKSLLEQKKLNAIQTESTPKQWRIYPSNYSLISSISEEKKLHFKPGSHTEDGNEKKNKNRIKNLIYIYS